MGSIWRTGARGKADTASKYVRKCKVACPEVPSVSPVRWTAFPVAGAPD